MKIGKVDRIATVASGLLLLVAAAALLPPGVTSAQGGGDITGIWQKCGGGGYLVLLPDQQQVNLVGAEVEVGSYAFDGSGVAITTRLYYPGQGSVVQQTRQARLAYDPQTGTLSGQGTCYSKLPQQ